MRLIAFFITMLSLCSVSWSIDLPRQTADPTPTQEVSAPPRNTPISVTPALVTPFPAVIGIVRNEGKVNVNIRSCPSTSCSIIGKLPIGGTAQIEDEINGWWKIADDAMRSAWVSASVVVFTRNQHG